MSQFNFKQFTVKQEKSAMKVGTDGVLLGAWVNCENRKSFLDVGTGTGLISLMIAQRNPSIIGKAVEIDNAAFEECQLNFTSSPWKERIEVVNGDYLSFSFEQKFDLIVSNPPYFKSGTKINDSAREQARYDGSLSIVALLQQSFLQLNNNGILALVLPFSYLNILEDQIPHVGFTIERLCIVKSKDTKPEERILIELIKGETGRNIRSVLTILKGSGRHDYTPEYVDLVLDFYTIL